MRVNGSVISAVKAVHTTPPPGRADTVLFSGEQRHSACMTRHAIYLGIQRY